MINLIKIPIKFVEIILKIMVLLTRSTNSETRLRAMFLMQGIIEEEIVKAACYYDNGAIPRARLTGVVKLIKKNLQPGDKILVIHSGTTDIVNQARCYIGSEIDSVLLDRNESENDLLNCLSSHIGRHYKMIVVWEGLECRKDRINILKILRDIYKPKMWLVCVPQLFRSWEIPLRAEVLSPIFARPFHRIEYTEASLSDELLLAGLRIGRIRSEFGEIWATAYTE